MLNNFMYMSTATASKPGTPLREVIEYTLKDLQEPKKFSDMRDLRDLDNVIMDKPFTSLTGGLSREDAILILEDMKNSERISNLTIAKSDESIDATCFVDNEGNATVAFQGTGGTYDKWNDNIVAVLDADTRYRQKANDFIQKDLAGYENITVTGHSKGGNLAQHVTVQNSDRIDRCVSFDGQGFSADYIRENKEKIAAVQDRMTGIHGENDYVNGLENSIINNNIYIKGVGHDAASFHSSAELYFAATYNESGDFSAFSITHQPSPFARQIERIADLYLDKINQLPLAQREGAIKAFGMFLGSVLGRSDLKGLGWDALEFTIGNLLNSWEYSRGILRALKELFSMVPELAEAFILYDGSINRASKAAREPKMAKKQREKRYGGGFGGGGSGGGRFGGSAERTVHDPAMLNMVASRLRTWAGEMEALAGQTNGVLRFCNRSLSGYALRSRTSLRLRASGMPSVRAGSLSQTIQAYTRLMNAYADKLRDLSGGVSRACDIFEETEAKLVSMASQTPIS